MGPTVTPEISATELGVAADSIARELLSALSTSGPALPGRDDEDRSAPRQRAASATEKHLPARGDATRARASSGASTRGSSAAAPSEQPAPGRAPKLRMKPPLPAFDHSSSGQVQGGTKGGGAGAAAGLRTPPKPQPPWDGTTTRPAVGSRSPQGCVASSSSTVGAMKATSKGGGRVQSPPSGTTRPVAASAKSRDRRASGNDDEGAERPAYSLLGLIRCQISILSVTRASRCPHPQAPRF